MGLWTHHLMRRQTRELKAQTARMGPLPKRQKRWRPADLTAEEKAYMAAHVPEEARRQKPDRP